MFLTKFVFIYLSHIVSNDILLGHRALSSWNKFCNKILIGSLNRNNHDCCQFIPLSNKVDKHYSNIVTLEFSDTF